MTSPFLLVGVMVRSECNLRRIRIKAARPAPDGAQHFNTSSFKTLPFFTTK
jgi:hypothetical protein